MCDFILQIYNLESLVINTTGNWFQLDLSSE